MNRQRETHAHVHRRGREGRRDEREKEGGAIESEEEGGEIEREREKEG